MKVYLSYAIDQAAQDAGGVRSSVERLKQMLSHHPYLSYVYEPGRAFPVVGPQFSDGLAEINRFCLDASDVLFAWLPSRVASVGVPMEIDRAVRAGKLVVIFSDADAWMLQYPENPYIRRYFSWEEEDLRDAVGYLSTLPAQEALGDTLPICGDGAIPTRGHDDDAGLDLYVSQTTIVEPGQFNDIPCDISVQLPEWSWGMITGRSSTLRKRGLLVHMGVIDAGYRGEIFCGVWNLTNEPVKVLAGERVAQLVILKNSTSRVHPVRAESLNSGSRGTAGFGSTGD